MSILSVIDGAGVAVITGGASGFGLHVAERCVKSGMAVAILDVSESELAKAEQRLRSLAIDPQDVLAVKCDVTHIEECRAAEESVSRAFSARGVSFLFNNAGILGREGGMIIAGSPDAWKQTFSVNVFGAVHILKSFLPGMIKRGPLPSGKKSYVVTTSSVVGLLNHNLGPYSCSKMAATAICEQLSIELEGMGAQASHISPHSLHPTVSATNFLTGRGADGEKTQDGAVISKLSQAGMSTVDHIVDGLFRGLEDGKHYIIVDHLLDVPTAQQIAMRMQDQMDGSRPRKPEQLAMMLMMTGDQKALKKREEQIAQQTASKL